MIKPYDKFLEYLYSLEDNKYREFSSKLIFDSNIIGIRTPILKQIAREISVSDYNYFILNNTHKTYEENMLEGLVLGYLKIDFNNVIDLLNNFVKYIDNWAVCDQTAANLKIFKKNKDKGLNAIKKYLKDKNYWINRFGYVLLLDYYIEDKYLYEIFKFFDDYKDEYYVKMSIAWLISTCYIKYKDKTIEYLKNNTLDDWTFNKAIQKIIESKRVSLKDKEYLKGLKRK